VLCRSKSVDANPQHRDGQSMCDRRSDPPDQKIVGLDASVEGHPNANRNNIEG